MIALSDPTVSANCESRAVRNGSLAMELYVGNTPSGSQIGATQSHEWVHHVLALLEAAIGQLDHEPVVHGTIMKAVLLLRKQVVLEAAQSTLSNRGGLVAWQARKVREYIDKHIAGAVRVADLSALIQRSDAHFSRSFKRTFGESPHAFVIRRRLELASQCMLSTDALLSDIAVRCGFTDQAHLSKLFRQFAGEPPASWRRIRRVATGFTERERDGLVADRTQAVSAHGAHGSLAVQVGS